MPKNINVAVSDELSARMEQMKDVNWSAVTRECIEQYIKQRTSGGLEVAISRIKAMRGGEFKEGYEFVIKNGESLGLAALEEIGHPVEETHTELLFDLINKDMIDEIFRYDNLPPFDITGRSVGNIRYKVSSNFIKGMQEAAKELLEKSE